jgi:class 3 adenylate cyclase/tetratricopeptide (TPR) repeat protein
LPVTTCDVCGRENRPDSRFCDACGAVLTAGELREVRKVVTVLFCDVTGSTALGERLEPESLRKVMERYFAVARDVLERHGASVEKFIGDAVMAVFGIPVVHEDDALRAARAACDLRDDLRELNGELHRDFEVELAVRIGVNTGQVVTGTGATLATGDAVNVAARLEQAAQPNEILIGERTRQLAESALDVEPVPDVEAKGKSEPVRAFRLNRVRADVPAITRRFDSPFVGRVDELAQLAQARARAERESACYLFTVLGSPGVGKSRLTEEFLKSSSDAVVLRGRCLAYGEGITYFPLVEILEQIAADAALTAQLENDDTARRLLNRVSAAAGFAAEPALGREESFQAVRKLFETLARRKPLVVVFDDLHWAEPTLLDLVDHIADWSRGAPILLMCLARPELLDLRSGWAGGKLNATTLLLEALSRSESDTLIDNLLLGADLAPALRRRIAATAEGNPLFVEHMLALIKQNGDRSGDEIEVPGTIQALLAARLEQLSTEERMTAERASVIGKEFWRAAVVELEGDAAALPSLVRKELIRPHRSSVFPDDDAFRFRHLLVRDAAYDAMPKELRAELHGRFGRWLEQRRSEFDEIVGYHFEQAFRLREQLGPVGADTRELASRAADHLGAAGQRALDRGDVPAAINLLTRATELLPTEGSESRRLEIELGWALFDNGQLDRAEAAFVTSRDHAEIAGDDAVACRARVGLLMLETQRNEPIEEQLVAAQREIETLERLGDDAGLAEALEAEGMLQTWLGRTAAAAASSERAARHARASEHRRLERRVQASKVIQEAWGHLAAAEGVRACDELLERARGTALEPYVLAARALHRAWLGEVADARKDIRHARTLLADFGDELMASATGMIEAHVELAAGEPRAAEATARPAYEALARIGDQGYRSTVGCYLARAVYEQGRYAEAETLALEAGALASADDFSSQSLARRVRARVLAQRGELENAEALAREAVDTTARTDSFGERGDALADLADVLMLAGRVDEADACLDAAAELYERKGALALAEAARRRAIER